MSSPRICKHCNNSYKLDKKSPVTREHCYTCSPFGNRNIKKNYKKSKRGKAAADGLKHSCLLCGYDKCKAALHFHHKDPSNKDSDISSITKNGSIARIEEEIAKCVVLCANCHAEAHAFGYVFD